MIRTRRKVSVSYMNASGVALADILANSVAVLLILILLMVNIKQQQAEMQLEQTVDISVLMARKLANSVVLDALPNSRPAYLHDYSSCNIAHDCNPYLYPLIQIFDDRVALFNPPVSFTRAQLLSENNLFDKYMRGLNNDQLNNIRVDIYGIGMFYLAVATLREYGAPLNHWHFLGEKAAAGKGRQEREGVDELAKLLEAGEVGLSPESGDDEGDSVGGPIPDGTSLADAEQLQGLESDSLLPNDIAGEDSTEDLQGKSGSLLDELLGEFAKRRGQKAEGESSQPLAKNNGKTFRLRIPNFNPSEQAKPINLDLNQDTLEKVLLGFIFAALNDANQNRHFDPKRLGELFASIAASPNSFASAVSPSLIRDIQQILQQIPTLRDKLASIDFGDKPRSNSEPVTLMVKPNSAIEKLTLQSAEIIPNQRELLSESSAAIDLLLRSYPFVYRGERVKIVPNMLILSLPKSLRSSAMQWRPVAIITPDLQEITLGFAQANYHNGSLNFPLEVNQIRANGAVLQTDFEVLAERSLWQVSASYVITILLVGLLLWLFTRWYLRSGTNLVRANKRFD